MLKRADERTRTAAAAKINFGGRAIDCVVRDMSAGGARLRVPDAGAVPAQFELFVPATNFSRPARVRWRRKGEIGVAFMVERRGFGRRLVPPSTPLA